MKRHLRSLLIATSACLGACVTSTSAPPPLEIESGAVDRLLEEFVAASVELDVDRMSALFFPPDDTPAGENRRLHLKAIAEEWPPAREEGRELQMTFRKVMFDDTTGLVTAELVARSGSNAGVQLLEMLVAPTDDGLKIGALRMPSAVR